MLKVSLMLCKDLKPNEFMNFLWEKILFVQEGIEITLT
jgi:hypothetical protein